MLADFQQEIAVLQRKKLPIPKRKIDALANNKAWELSIINRINELQGKQ